MSRRGDSGNGLTAPSPSIKQSQQASLSSDTRSSDDASQREEYISDDNCVCENASDRACDYRDVGPRNDWQTAGSDRLWVRTEALLWWPKGTGLPPLVTTSPAGTTPSNSGILGQAGTATLFGDGRVNDSAASGGRFTIGCWLTPCQDVGVEANYLFLGGAATHYQADSSTMPILARPYINTNTGNQTAFLVAHPDYLAGSVTIDVTTSFQASEVVLRRLFFDECGEKVTFLVGYRFAQLDDDLAIEQASRWTVRQGQILAGTTKNLSDVFGVANDFQGGEIGLAYQERVGRWSLDSWVKLGLGNTHSSVAITGQTVTTVPSGQSSTYTGGLLAQETNIGRYTHDEFSMLPEFGVTLGYDITCQLHATVGYTFLYWTKITRAADQVNLGASQLPPESPTGSRQPQFPFATSDFWAQGMNIGLEYKF